MLDYKIGIMIDGFKLPMNEALHTAALIGADALQLTAVGIEDAPLDMDATGRKELYRRICGEGLSVSAVCGDLGGHGFTLAEENPGKIETSKRIVDLALEMGTKVITTHIGVIPAVKNETYNTMLEACGELGLYAHSHGARFAIETGPATPEVLCGFIEDLGTDGIAVNYDPANLVMVTGVDPVKGVHTLSGKIAHTHAKDGVMLKKTDPKVIYDFFAEGGIGDLRMEDYFRELPLGSGDVDIPAWIKALSDVGYAGYITVEREAGPDPVGDIRLAVTTLRNIFASL